MNKKILRIYGIIALFIVFLTSCNSYTSKTEVISFSLDAQSLQTMIDHMGGSRAMQTPYQISESTQWVLEVSLSGDYSETKSTEFNLQSVIGGESLSPKIDFATVSIGSSVVATMKIFKKEDTQKNDGIFSGSSSQTTILAGKNRINVPISWIAPRIEAYMNSRIPLELHANPGDTIQLFADFYKEGVATTWTSSDSTIASVTESGLVTIKSVDVNSTATITASTTEILPSEFEDDTSGTNNKQAICTINIPKAPHAKIAVIKRQAVGQSLDYTETSVMSVQVEIPEFHRLEIKWYCLEKPEFDNNIQTKLIENSTKILEDSSSIRTVELQQEIPRPWYTNQWVFCTIELTDTKNTNPNTNKSMIITKTALNKWSSPPSLPS